MILKALKHSNVLSINDIYTFSLSTYIFPTSNASVSIEDDSFKVQNESLALKNVIIEEYFIPASKNSISNTESPISACSIIYRIYIEIKPDYTLQLIYGKHELLIKTSGKFQNNKVCRDIASFNINPKRNIENKVDSDSWITMGSVTKSNSGNSKTESQDNLLINKIFLQNDQNFMNGKLPFNKPFKFELNFFSDKSHVNEFYDNHHKELQQFDFKDDGNHNRILIAQLTTKEKLNFELNIQSGNISYDSLNFIENDTKCSPIQKVNSTNSQTQTL
jgi:hypothetical protein